MSADRVRSGATRIEVVDLAAGSVNVSQTVPLFLFPLGIGLDGSIVPGPRTTARQAIWGIRHGVALVTSADNDGFIVIGLYAW